MKRSPPRVAVIGAGIAGLACAYTLHKHGIPVTVFEPNRYPGGRMTSRPSSGFQFNPGATLLSRNYPQLTQLAKELKIPLTPLKPGSWHVVLRGGRVYPYGVNGPIGILRLPFLSFGARLRLLGFILRHLRPIPGDFFDLTTVPKELDFASAGRYLRRAVGDEVVDYLLDPFIAGLHFYRTQDLSTASLFAMIAMMQRYHGLHARHPEGGMGSIPRALASKLTVRYGAQVRSVRRGRAGCLVRVNGRLERFDRVVLACPAPAALKLLTPPSPAQRAMLRSIRYSASIVVALRVPADLLPEGLHCIYVPYVENRIISCCMAEERKGSELVKNGQSLLNLYLHDEAAKRLMNESDGQIGRTVRAEFLSLWPQAKSRQALVVVHELARWPLAMPTFPHQTVSRVSEFLKDYQGEGGIYFAGDYLNAPWTEGAAQSGVRVAKLIQARSGAEAASRA